MIYYRGTPIDELSAEKRKEYGNLWWRIDLLPQNIDYLGAPHETAPIKVNWFKRILTTFIK